MVVLEAFKCVAQYVLGNSNVYEPTLGTYLYSSTVCLTTSRRPSGEMIPLQTSYLKRSRGRGHV